MRIGALAGEDPFGDRVDCRAGVAACRSGFARRHQARQGGHRGGLRLQLIDDGIDFFPRLTELRVELLVETLAERVFPLAQRVFALVHARLGLLERLAFPGRQPVFVLERPHVAVDLREVLRELRLARAEVFPRRRDHRRVEAETTGNFQRKTAARRAVHQLVGRRERLRIESEGAARDALGGRGVCLEGVVVAGCEHRRASTAEVIDDRDAKRPALDRIGARADFVEQHQRGRHQRPIHGGDVGDVRRKRAEARCD